MTYMYATFSLFQVTKELLEAQYLLVFGRNERCFQVIGMKKWKSSKKYSRKEYK